VTHSEFSKGAVKLNPYLLKSTVVAAMGGLLFGFDTAVIAGTTHSLTETFGCEQTDSALVAGTDIWIAEDPVSR
jgi:MFS transporter, SP family, arabinose:H+ symporter